MLRQVIEKLSSGQTLSRGEMGQVMDQFMAGQADAESIAEILGLLHRRGETAEELTGAALAMREHMRPLRCEHPHAVDTCGTGGSGAGIFNVSTAAAFVAAACGVAVAKHGNRKATSPSGSSDVLAELGIEVDRSIEDAETCLQQVGLCFCHAPLFHPAVKHVAEVRRALPHPTIFNLLGPLCNPAGTPHHVLGAGRGETQRLLAEALAKLGDTRSVVVHGLDGLGEVSTAGTTRVFEVEDGRIEQSRWQPFDFGLPVSPVEALRVSGPAESAELIRRVLGGGVGPARDIVVINAAAAVWVTGVAADLEQAARRCEEAIDSGAAADKLEQLVEMSRELAAC